MKKTSLLHSEISFLLSSMGHTDFIVIADSGLPVPRNVKKIDLALTKGVPGFLETLQVVLTELCVEEVIIAKEMKEHSPQIEEQIHSLVESSMIKTVTHEEFKETSKRALAVIRTGEFTPYANCILKSGVVF